MLDFVFKMAAVGFPITLLTEIWLASVSDTRTFSLIMLRQVIDVTVNLMNLISEIMDFVFKMMRFALKMVIMLRQPARL